MRTINILILFILLSTIASSCKSCFAGYEERKAGLNRVCPDCNLVTNNGSYYAIDTSIQPNKIYRVYFKNGGVYYKASDVDHLEVVE